ncbi:MAG: hypothetical protein AB1696_25915 [Planctomycetota bacterium]
MDADENRIEAFLAAKEFTCRRFPKTELRAGKTPDFRVYAEGEFRFFCEAKTIDRDYSLIEIVRQAPAGTVVGHARKDPIFNRLTDDIHKAAKQFDAVNPEEKYPNVLVLVNHDSKCRFNDLLQVLTGCFFAEGGRAYPISRKFSEGRIKDEKGRIHLFIWLDDFKPDQWLFSQTNERHHMNLCSWFGINPDSIRKIGS